MAALNDLGPFNWVSTDSAPVPGLGELEQVEQRVKDLKTKLQEASGYGGGLVQTVNL